MKKLMFLFVLVLPCYLFAQIGIKAGLNFANVTKASTINGSSRSGFHAGLLLGAASKKIFGFQTEFMYSKQGYDYKSGTKTGTVDLDYITSVNLTCINITKYFSIQFGAQTAFLLNAKVDSSGSSTGNASLDKAMDFYNRFDYGFAGGIEIHPVSGLLIGARMNISFSNLYKDFSSGSSGTPPSFVPKVDVKNNLFQIFAGWKFGGNKKADKKKEKEE
jgi:Outer membrane protein beta-barrel domain